MKDVELQILYERYVNADTAESARRLSAVTEHMKPILAGIVFQQMRGRERVDQEDVCSLIMTILVRKLQEKRDRHEQFVDLRAYLVAVARHEILRFCRSLQTQSKTTISIETFERSGDQQAGPSKTPHSLQVHDAAKGVIRRDYLTAVWEALRHFPPHQCRALLLQGHDLSSGTSIVDLLEMCQIASHREMAASMGMTSEEFGMWRDELPVTDAKIADHYGQPAKSISLWRMRLRRKLEEQMQANDTIPLAVQPRYGGKA